MYRLRHKINHKIMHSWDRTSTNSKKGTHHSPELKFNLIIMSKCVLLFYSILTISEITPLDGTWCEMRQLAETTLATNFSFHFNGNTTRSVFDWNESALCENSEPEKLEKVCFCCFRMFVLQHQSWPRLTRYCIMSPNAFVLQLPRPC